MESKAFKEWCQRNGAVMISHTKGDAWVVFIQTPGRRYRGVGESLNFEEAVRFAQHGYDAALLLEVFHAPVVGRA